MTKYEINKTIAEYMGHEYNQLYCKLCGIHDDCPEYTESLDACVPVVKKLLRGKRDTYGWIRQLVSDPLTTAFKFKESPSLALATALAECIKEIEK
jgi:hypothetical protein